VSRSARAAAQNVVGPPAGAHGAIWAGRRRRSAAAALTEVVGWRAGERDEDNARALNELVAVTEKPQMTQIETIALEPVDSLSITTLVDNVTDILLLDEGPARRPPLGSGPRVAAPVLEGGRGLDALRAEHGFSALVTVSRGGREQRVLFDTGITPDGLVENMRRLELSPHDVEAIVLSHGHFDHTTGLDGLIRTLGRSNLPVVIHPEFWSRRRIAIPGRDPVLMPSTSRRALEDTGFEIVEQRQPSFLLDGSLLVTGEVDRTTEFERGFLIHEARREGGWRPDPLILDDQALVADVRGKGLVVLTACGHAGVVNTVRYALKLTGRDRLHAIVGGFHLNGPLFEPLIPATCDALAELSPDYLVPAHCTGWRATHALAARFPDAYLQNSVGTRFEFHAAGRQPDAT
jgi:7,8-dihydropterin-6-yl-methyl-4-(beta-D-ribofuranosyl)aminobenzene 5'-phosphate synthase